MARLTYTALCSLDGYIEDGGGGFGWAMPDRELHAFVNERERGTGTMLLGRRMYETLAVWETMPTEGEPAELADYKEIWLGADKVVYSRKLREPASGRTRIEAEFDPAAVRRMKEAPTATSASAAPRSPPPRSPRDSSTRSGSSSSRWSSAAARALPEEPVSRSSCARSGGS